MAAFLNNVWNTAASTATNVMGPDYSYVDKIPSTDKLGVGDAGNFGQMGTNMNAGFTYVGYMTKGPALGNAYFTNTGGTCINTQGVLVNRYNYINNTPDKRGVIGGIFGEGLISGILGDVASMNPGYLMTAIKADATPACDLYRCPVTDVLNEPAGGASFYSPGSEDTRYLSRGLSPDLGRELCTKVDLGDPKTAVNAKITERDALQKKYNELTELVSKNPSNRDLKNTRADVYEKLQQANDDVLNMQSRAESRREAFGIMSSPATGGLLLAGILLTYLVFSKRR